MCIVMGKYLFLHLKLIVNLVAKRKITVRKVINAARCYLAYYWKKSQSGSFPIVMIMDISNRCNYYCVACRETPTKIYNQNRQGGFSTIAIGDMDLVLYKRVVAEIKRDSMIAILYANGEPLIRKELFDMLQFATVNRMATMISTNGMLMTVDRAEQLLRAGVDFVKISVSGFSQDIYAMYHRGGNIETVKKNITGIVEAKKRLKSHTLIMVDYILFRHNRDEVGLFRRFCKSLGVIFNERAGITQGREGIVSSDERGVLAPRTSLCDWLWKIMVVNWDGAVLPCCEFTTWSDPWGMNRGQKGRFSVREVWNADLYKKFREIHINKGRQSVARCADCHYQGIKRSFILYIDR